MEFIWVVIKRWRSTRYEAVGVREYGKRFCDEISEGDRTNVVDPCYRAAEGTIEADSVLFLDDDLAPDPVGSDGGIGGRRRSDTRRINIAAAMRRVGSNGVHIATPRRMRTPPAKEINRGLLAGPFFCFYMSFPRRFALVWELPQTPCPPWAPLGSQKPIENAYLL